MYNMNFSKCNAIWLPAFKMLLNLLNPYLAHFWKVMMQKIYLRHNRCIKIIMLWYAIWIISVLDNKNKNIPDLKVIQI